MRLPRLITKVPPDDSVAPGSAAEVAVAATMPAVAAPLVPAIALAEATTDASHKRTRADAGSTDDDNDDDEEDDDVPVSELDDASVVDLADVSADRVEDFAEEKDPQFLVCKLHSPYAVQGRLKSQHAAKLKQAIYGKLDGIAKHGKEHRPPLVARAAARWKLMRADRPLSARGAC